MTVSNGVTKIDIANGPGGVAVYSGSPGTITVTNGKESQTLRGGSVTLFGDVIGVGAAQNVQVGARNGEGNTVVAIKPQPAPANVPVPAHVTGGPEGGFFSALGNGIKDGIKDVAGHLDPVPEYRTTPLPPKTSTSTQQ